MSSKKITNVIGRMVFDSRGYPTVEAEVQVNNNFYGASISPSGASKGKKEALEKRDNDENIFLGNSINENIFIINNKIKDTLVGINVEDQISIDKKLIELDGTNNKSKIGANTTIAVSMASLKAAAAANKTSMWEYLNNSSEKKLPLPEIQIIGGGAHAKGSIPIQDFMIIPNGAPDFHTALHWVFKIYKLAGEKLFSENKLYGVADEGGYWPYFNDINSVLDFLVKIIKDAGFEPFRQVSLSLDIAANNFKFNKKYKMSNKKNILFNSNDLYNYILKLIKSYPIISIEDPFAEEDIEYFKKLKENSPSYLQIVGDDLVVTNTKLIKNAYKKNAINSILIKPNQIGTISETSNALKLSNELNLMSILSARSGESEDNFISDLSVGWKMKQLKVGSFSRSERMSKWNQCLRIGEKFKDKYAMHKIWNF